MSEKFLSELRDLLDSDISTNFLFDKSKEICGYDKYKHIRTEEPFYNMYGKLCYDYSGEVYIDNEMELDPEDTLEFCFQDVYNGEKIASYEPNHGWYYQTFLNDLEQFWLDFKSDTFANFLENNKDAIIKEYNIEDWEDVFDELDDTDLGEYFFWGSEDIFYNFIKCTKIKDIL